MAIFIEGMKCGLCGSPMAIGATVSFPPFVANELDPLWMFNDATFHTCCFQAHPLSKKAETRLSELKRYCVPGCLICNVCGSTINDPDDFVSVGFLSDAPPLSQFNYKMFHQQKCLARWPDLANLREQLQAALAMGSVKGRAFRVLLEELTLR